MPPLPPSARSLRRALRPETRPNPSEDDGRPFRLWTQRPETEQTWVDRGLYAELDAALEEVAFPAQAPGTVVRVTTTRVTPRGTEAWLGVIDPAGAAVSAPPCPRPPDAAKGWVEAWEGLYAEGPWMLARCTGVDRRRLVLAAAACVLPARDALAPSDPRIDRAVAAARAWAESPPGLSKALAEAADEASLAVRLWRGGISVQTPLGALAAAAGGAAEAAACAKRLLWKDFLGWIVDVASDAAAAQVSGEGAGGDVRRAQATAARRAQAPLVRRYVSLGMVLSAQVAQSRTA